MESDESPLNIFRKSAKEDSQKTGTKTNATNSAAKSATRSAPSLPANSGIKQTQEMMRQMKEMQASIEEELEKIVKVSGFSKKQIWDYLEDKNHFNHEQMAKAEAELKDLKQAISNSLLIVPSDLAYPPTTTHHRKTKFSGARRNWLSTH